MSKNPSIFDKLCRIADKYGYDEKEFVVKVLKAYKRMNSPKPTDKKDRADE